MNWYKHAQQSALKPPISSDLVTSWIDPLGVIYSCERYSHLEWIRKYADFLMDNYDLYSEFTNAGHIMGLMLNQGWVRFMELTFYYFEIQGLKYFILRNLEKILYQTLSPSSHKKIDIDFIESNYIAFKWVDFISSGQSFVDFVKDQARSQA